MAKAAVENDLSLPDEIIEERASENPVRPFQKIFSHWTIKELLLNSLQLFLQPPQVCSSCVRMFIRLKVKIQLSIQKSLPG